MEQRIQVIEEEVKLLKNQIRSVLLDIKESLASGDWQIPVKEGKVVDLMDETDQQLSLQGNNSGSNGKAKGEEMSLPVSPLEEQEEETVKESPEVSGKVPVPYPERNRRARYSEDGNGQADRLPAHPAGMMEPVTLLLLLEWLDRSRGKLGKEETDKLIELYASLYSLPQEAQQTLKLLNGLSSKDGDSQSTLNSLPFLLELDSLLRYPSPAPGALNYLTLNLLAKNQGGNH